MTSRRRHRLGQHFLTDARVIERQIRFADLSESDVILEIGPGLGALTKRLLPLVSRVIAIELDPAMIEELERQGLTTKNLQLLKADAAEFDYASLGRIDKVVANLPYSASSPITFRLLRLPIERAVLMYQREFAERMVAPPRSEGYGRLAAAVAFYAKAEILERVPRTAFTPPPEVDSAIVRLTPHPKPPFPVHRPETYEELLRVLFSTRRKTVRSTLRRQHEEIGLHDWGRVEAVLAAVGFADARPEELTPEALGLLDLRLGALRA